MERCTYVLASVSRVNFMQILFHKWLFLINHVEYSCMPSNKTSQVFCYTYVLESRPDNKRYIGYTRDLRRREAEHFAGDVFSTSYRGTLSLIYYEACRDEHDARQRERYLKTTAGRRFLAKRLRHFKLSKLGVSFK